MPHYLEHCMYISGAMFSDALHLEFLSILGRVGDGYFSSVSIVLKILQ